MGYNLQQHMVIPNVLHIPLSESTNKIKGFSNVP